MGSFSQDIPPWRRSPSIYDHIRRNALADGSGLLPGAWDLPDKRNRGGNAAEFAGWMELWGVFVAKNMPPLAERDPNGLVERLVEAMRAYCQSPTDDCKLAVYAAIQSEGVSADTMVRLLEGLPDWLDNPAMADLALSLVMESPDRNPVKLGLVLLGRSGNRDSVPLFRLIGLHDEFTLYCADGLSRIAQTPERELWELAQHVHGCGRVMAIRYLANTRDREIRDWILRRGLAGVRDTPVVREELAHQCARAGRLADALSQESVDDELLAAAGEMIEELLSTPFSLGRHPDLAVTISAYLTRQAHRSLTLHDLAAVASIREFIRSTGGKLRVTNSTGVTEQSPYPIGLCDTILAQSACREAVLNGLYSEDEQRFDRAARVAMAISLDAWRWHWPRLQAAPDDPRRWHFAMGSSTPERLNDVLDLARQHLARPEVCPGPTVESTGGPPEEECLAEVARGLRRFPGQGLDLLAAAMNTRGYPCRMTSLRTLVAWGGECWPEGTREMLEEAAAREPSPMVLHRIERALR